VRDRDGDGAIEDQSRVEKSRVGYGCFGYVRACVRA
jgi:hypothetical protein